MRAPVFILGVVFALTGCSSDSDKAERQYKLVRDNPTATAEDICAAGRAVADAYLQAEQSAKYREASLRASILCRRAQLDEQAALR